MRKASEYISPLTRTDKLYALLLVVTFLAPNLAVLAMDEAAIRAAEAEADNPDIVIAISTPHIDFTPLIETIEAHREELFWQTVPLDQECREALQEACEENGIPVCLALGLIEVENGFQSDVVSSGGDYGLCQLNPKYFPEGLTPAENITAGVAHLGELLGQYETLEAALTCYNAGCDTGSRLYADSVSEAAKKWRCK